MSDEAPDRFEIPKEMRSMAEASFEQARKTFEKFVASAQAAAGSIEERNADLASDLVRDHTMRLRDYIRGSWRHIAGETAS